MNETDRSVFRLQSLSLRKNTQTKTLNVDFCDFFFSVYESTLVFTLRISSQRQSTRGRMCRSVCQWRFSARLHPSAAAVFTHVWTNSCFFAAKSFLIFSQKEREKIWKHFLAAFSHSEVEAHTDFGSKLSISCSSVTVSESILTSFFCKYQMQLRCKQSKARACSVINNHLFRRQEGCWEGKAKTRHYCIEKLINVHYWKKYIMRGNNV